MTLQFAGLIICHLLAADVGGDLEVSKRQEARANDFYVQAREAEELRVAEAEVALAAFGVVLGVGTGFTLTPVSAALGVLVETILTGRSSTGLVAIALVMGVPPALGVVGAVAGTAFATHNEGYIWQRISMFTSLLGAASSVVPAAGVSALTLLVLDYRLRYGPYAYYAGLEVLALGAVAVSIALMLGGILGVGVAWLGRWAVRWSGEALISPLGHAALE